MSTLSRLVEPFWTREFVANHFWKFIGVVTLGLLLLAGTLELDLAAELIVVIGWFLLLPIFLFFGDQIASAVFDEDETDVNVEMNNSLESSDSLETIRNRYARANSPRRSSSDVSNDCWRPKAERFRRRSRSFRRPPERAGFVPRRARIGPPSHRQRAGSRPAGPTLPRPEIPSERPLTE